MCSATYVDYSLQLSFVTGFTAAQLTSMTSTPCIGDDVTYTCNVASLVHTWNLGSSTADVVNGDTIGVPETVGVYTLVLVSRNSSGLVSTLSLTAFGGFNGTNISCRDGLAVTNPEVQETSALVFGETL